MKLHLSELHYNLGHVLHQQGDLAGSVAAYREAIRLDRSFVQAHHSLAVVLAEQGQTHAAIWHYQQAIALQPKAVKAYNNLGCLLMQQEKLAEAAKLYRQAIAIDPHQAILHSNFGRSVEVQDPTAAIAAYRQAIQLQPDLGAAHYNLGKLFLQQGQHAAAIDCFQTLLQFSPDHLEAQTACGHAYLGLRDFYSALHWFRQALRDSLPYVKAFCIWVDSLSGDDELTLARKACGRLLRSLLRANPTDRADRSAQLETLDSLAQTYQHLGNLLLQYGGTAQLRQAETYYQQAIFLQPQNIDLYFQLGACLEQQQRWNAASMLYQTVQVSHPHNATLHHRWGRLLEQRQRWPEAISHYRQAMQLIGKQAAASQRLPDSVHISALAPVSVPSTLPIQGIYRQTRAWIEQHSQGRWVELQLDSSQLPWPAPPEATPGSTISGSTLPASTMLPRSDATPPADCDGLNCPPCLQKLTQHFLPIHLGQHVYQLSQKQPTLSVSGFFVAHLPQAQAWIAPYRAAWMVTNSLAVLSADRYLLADVSREYPGQLPICTQPHASFQRILQHSPPPPEVMTGRVAVLAGLSGHNYFHWMVDVLPRFELLRRSGLRGSDVDWFWVHQGQAAFQQEMLDYLDIPHHKVLAADQHPAIQAETLIVPSFPGHLGWPEPWALAFLRQQFLPIATAFPQHEHPYERIYISRAKAHHRRLLNEAEVIAQLQPLDFSIVELETLSVAAQIALFAQAKVIVAPHGGGLTNLIFCQPGTTVIELMSPRYIRHYYWHISQQLGLKHYFAIGSAFSCPTIHQLMYPSPLMEDVWLESDTLKLALAQAGIG